MALQEIRKARGLSQSQLANKAKVNFRTLQYYEQGATDINGAKLSTLIKLAQALECKITDILSDKELIENCSTIEL